MPRWKLEALKVEEQEAVEFAIAHFPAIIKDRQKGLQFHLWDEGKEVVLEFGYDLLQWWFEVVLLFTGHKIMIDNSWFEKKMVDFINKKPDEMCVTLILYSDWTQREGVYKGEHPVKEFTAKGAECVQRCVAEISEWMLAKEEGSVWLKKCINTKIVELCAGSVRPMNFVLHGLGMIPKPKEREDESDDEKEECIDTADSAK